MALLESYRREWKRYVSSSRLLNHLFQYLNRHWIKREIEEGHVGVSDVYTVGARPSLRFAAY